MASENLYELAYRFYDTKLWKKVGGTELFAVTLADGEIGYCSVTGLSEDTVSLTLYPGDAGYRSFRRIIRHDSDPAGMAETMNVIATMDCLRCSFVDRDDLSDQETAEVRTFAAAHRRNLRGSRAYVGFSKHEFGCVGWHLETDRDEWRMTRALEAALALSGMLLRTSGEELGLCPIGREPDRVPLLTRRGREWELSHTPLPAAEDSWQEVSFENELTLTRVRRLARSGIWECNMTYVSNPFPGADPHAALVYPLMLCSTDALTGDMLAPSISNEGKEGELLDEFARMMLEKNERPTRIRCGDDRTFALLKDFCAGTGIERERKELSRAARENADALAEEMGKPDEEIFGEDPDDIHWMDQAEVDQFLVDTLSGISDEALIGLTEFAQQDLLKMVDDGRLPLPLAARLDRLLRKKD